MSPDFLFSIVTDFKKGAISAIGLNYKGGNNRDIVCDGCSTLSEPLQNKHWGFPESFTCSMI